MKRHPRLTYTLRYRAGLWALIAPDGESCLSGVYKAALTADCADSLMYAWRTLRIRSELRICDRWGKVVDSRTYGEDPRATKG